MAVPSPEIPWRRSVGGRWAVSWQAFAVIGLTGALLTAANAPDTVADWAILSVCSVVALGLVFIVAHLTLLRDRADTPVAMTTVLAVGVLAGMARGGAVVGTAALLDVDLLRPWPVVLIAGTLIVALLTVGLALVFDHASRTLRTCGSRTPAAKTWR